MVVLSLSYCQFETTQVMKLLVFSTLLLLFGVSEVYSLKCYSCASSIRNCLLPEHRDAVTCPGSLICHKATFYDHGESELGCSDRSVCEIESMKCEAGLSPHGRNCSIKCCTEELCNAEKSCEAGLDIGIVLDKSLSVKQQNLQNVILNLRDLISKSNPAPAADHFGLITFHNQPTLAFDFKDSTFYNKTALLNRIGQEPIAMKRWTRIDMALDMANRTLFSSQGGHRPGKRSLMIVFTDGVQAPKGGKKLQAFVDKMIKDLEQKGVFVIVVSISSPNNRQVLGHIAGPSGKVINGNALESTILDKKKDFGVC